MTDRTYRWLLITVAVLALTADLASKYGVFRWLYSNEKYSRVESAHTFECDVAPGWFKLIAQFDPDAPLCDCGFDRLQTWSAPLMPRVNHGALFGMGGSKKGTANGFFSIVSGLAAIAILAWGLRRTTAREKWLMVALGLILGGTVGNLYDRLVFNGVRDFLYFYKIEWPVFNLADCFLVVGAGLLLMQALFASPPVEQPVAAADEPAIPEGPKG